MENNYLELYIHIPFCEKKCNYCDFLSFNSDDYTIKSYINKLKEEIKYKKFLSQKYIISSIYIGGGTPSSIPSFYIVDVLKTIYENYNIKSSCEISIELNPHSSIYEKLKDYYDIGINRISFGVQSTNDDELKLLGRLHTYNDFLKCYDEAVHIGFKNINADLMYGIPNQTHLTFKNSLKNIMKLKLKHLSIYSLIVEEKTPFYDLHKKNELPLPTEDEILKCDDIIKNLTAYYNYIKYEISNYAKEGFICIHNYGYWSDIPYIGFGLGASSYIDNIRYKNISNINSYLLKEYDKYETCEDLDKYYDEIKILSKEDSMSEFFFLGMRKTAGVNTQQFFEKFNVDFEKIFEIPLKKYINLSLIKKECDNYFFSEQGMQISNKILSEFIL